MLIKRIVDTVMTVLILCLMAYQVTGEMAHEWIGIGLWLFLRNGMPNYLFFRVPFAFLDYDKAGWLVFLENLLMLLFPACVGFWLSILCRKAG